MKKVVNCGSLLEKTRMKLIYIAYKNVSVFDSQVTALLNHFIENDKIDEIILLVGVNYKSRFEQNKITNLNEKIKTKYYVHYPQYPIIERRTIASVSNILKQIKDLGSYTIHVRNDVLAYYVYKALKVLRADTGNLIADVRGAGIEQMLEYSNKNIIIRTLKVNQRQKVFKALQKIKKISVVSESLKKYVQNKIGKSNASIQVNSCLANGNFEYSVTQRVKIRQSLNIKDSEVLIVLSTGGNNAWQNTEESIRTLARLNYKILNLSKSKIKHPNVINLFVHYSNVPSYLCAADIALIWRDSSITNKVASPVKFSEYMACGLPVITNNSIDLVSDFIISNNAGIIIESIGDINDDIILDLKNIDRFKLSKLGSVTFGINAIVNQYIEFYKEVIK